MKVLEDGKMKKIGLLLMVCLVWIVGNANATTILYSDNFDGPALTPLNGTTPDVTMGGATWAAGADFEADGTVTFHGMQPAPGDTSLGDGAYLPFVPENGYIYELSATIDTRPSAIRNNNPKDWIALGFARTNDALNNQSRRFYDDPGGADLPGGEYWMMSRTNLAVAPNFDQDFVGYRTNNGNTFAGPALSCDNLKIVLDTTVPGWTVSWYFNGILDRTVNVGVGPPAFVNDPFGVPTQPYSDFNYIMISNNRCDGFIRQLTLTPEPATMLLLGIGSILALRRRK
jgi:hypothetical protein